MKPKQYNMPIDTIELWKANKSPIEILNACEFNITKYIMRQKGSDYDDYMKIKAYSDLALWCLSELDKEAEEYYKYCEEEQNS